MNHADRIQQHQLIRFAASTSVPTLHDKLSVLSDRVASLDQRLSEPSSSGLASDVAKLKEEVERLSNELKESKEASSEDVRTALKERDETWSSKLEAVETGWKSRMAEMEARWEGRLVKLEMQRGRSVSRFPTHKARLERCPPSSQLGISSATVQVLTYTDRASTTITWHLKLSPGQTART